MLGKVVLYPKPTNFTKGMAMKWLSTITDVRRFCALVSKDPDFVYVSNVAGGRSSMLTLSAAAELDSDMYVVGPYGKWIATVRRDGWHLRAKKMNIREKK